MPPNGKTFLYAIGLDNNCPPYTSDPVKTTDVLRIVLEILPVFLIQEMSLVHGFAILFL